jgi:WD40 repeat protein
MPARNITLEGHVARVTSISFHPKDSALLLSTSADHTARLWKLSADRQTVLETLVLLGHTDTVHSGVFSAGGNAIITASDDTKVRLWRPTWSFEELSIPESVGALFFADAGKQMWAAGQTKLYELVGDTLSGISTAAQSWAELYAARRPKSVAYTGQLGSLIKLPGLQLRSMSSRFSLRPLDLDRITSMSPDGRFVIDDQKQEKRVRQWDVSASVTPPDLERPADTYRALGISNDGAHIAWYSPDKNSLLITHGRQGSVLYAVQGQNIIESVRFNASGRKVAAAVEDYTVQVLDAENRKAPMTLRGHTRGILNIFQSRRSLPCEYQRRQDVANLGCGIGKRDRHGHPA